MTDDSGFAARCLLRAARAGTLATQHGGQPFASLVTPATAPDGDVLLLLSALSAHTRHLAGEARCALMVCGVAEEANPQATPRLTVMGQAAPEPDPALLVRWRARHPYAALYAQFADFALWRLTIRSGHLVAGFARAHALEADSLRPDPTAVLAIQAEAATIMAGCNTDHAEALGLVARDHGHAHPGAWRMGAVDTDGMDLVSGDAVVRIAFDRPVATAAELRSAVVRLIQRAADRY